MQAALWNDPVRELSETCATSDMVSVAFWIAQAGFPEYWDHVERALRNYLRPQQFFVTADYEALYRKVNADKSEKEKRDTIESVAAESGLPAQIKHDIQSKIAIALGVSGLIAGSAGSHLAAVGLEMGAISSHLWKGNVPGAIPKYFIKGIWEWPDLFSRE